MKCRSFILAACVLFLALSGEARAHRVNVFAYVDGDAVQVECGFSKSQRVRNGKLTITDLETGEPVLEATTDANGEFRFRPSDAFLASGHGLKIRLDAGEGHQDEWKISAEELSALSEPFPPGAAAPPAATAASGAPAPSAAPPGPSAAPVSVGAEELEEIVGRVVEAKLGPIRQALARREQDGPELRDIVGGLGWILGLLGLAAYMKCRR